MRLMLFKLACAAGSVVVALVAAEVMLRLSEPGVSCAVWPPYLEYEFEPRAMRGITGRSRFTINSSGVRGDEPRDAATRVLAIGGSTTECLYLDDDETWPARLQSKLGEGGSAWVGNAGKSGRTADQHALDVELLLTQHDGIDTVLVLVGINDLHKRMMFGTKPYVPADIRVPAERESLVGRSFWRRSTGLRLSKVWRAASAVDKLSTVDQDIDGRVFDRLRSARASGTVIDTLPDLTDALRGYEANLHAIIDSALRHRVRLVLLTQPAMWHSDMSEDERASLWMGGVGDLFSSKERLYFSWRALREGLDIFNATLKRVAEERNVECFDLAAAVPKSLASFYDDVHFNEQGAETVASAIARYLADHPRPQLPPPPVRSELRLAEDLVPIEGWGPTHAQVGQPFNQQADGDCSIWLKLSRPLGFGQHVMVDGRMLRTTCRGKVASASVSLARVEQLVAQPGEIEVAIVDLTQRVKQVLGSLRVAAAR